MAGDWIKFELATLDKPEVCQIADAANIDLDAAVGKLLRVWGWFDQQTQDGNAPSVSKKLLDRLVGVNGFCELMKEVGWMIEKGSLISLPHFDRHNGQTAKNRALTAKRVANHKAKSNDEGNGAIVSDALPKEEKRREDKEQDQKLLLERFNSFWKLYPNKVAKPKALASFSKQCKDEADFLRIMHGLSQHILCEQFVKDDGKFIPHPTTWLNQERYNDEVKPYVKGSIAGASRPGSVSLVEKVRRANAHHFEPEPEQQAPGVDEDWPEFDRIREADGQLMDLDDCDVRPQVDVSPRRN